MSNKNILTILFDPLTGETKALNFNWLFLNALFEDFFYNEIYN
jgi:hypothetical protein